MNFRKALTLVCRARVIPEKGTDLYRQVQILSYDALSSIASIVTDPIRACLLQTLIRLAPISLLGIQEQLRISLGKELSAATRCRNPCTLNFSCFFGEYSKPLCPDIGANPDMAKYVHDAINRWVQRVSRAVLYPASSQKSMSKDTLRHYNQATGKAKNAVSKVDVERYYHNTGSHIGGISELRQVWYVSQLTPRSYFTIGGAQFKHSKYMWIFDMLSDEMECTNRVSRTSVSSLDVQPEDHLFVYDLTSFTSQLDCHEKFLWYLAEYTMDTHVTILDTHYGYMPVSLGGLIHEYRLHCYCNPVFENGVCRKPTLHCHVVGMLGDYGNIDSARFIHGAVVLQTCSNPSKLRIVGDDGLVATYDEKRQRRAIAHLGTLGDDKTYSSLTGSMVFLKKPLYHHVIARQDAVVHWPSLEYRLHNYEIDPRYPRLLSKGKKNRLATSAQVLSFLQSLQRVYLQPHDHTLIRSYLEYTYRVSNLPVDGSIGTHFVPSLSVRFGDDPVSGTVKRCYTGSARIPLRSKKPFESSLLRDTSFDCNSHKLLTVLVNLGYLRQKKQFIQVHGEEGLEQVVSAWQCTEPNVYHYTILCNLPNWVNY